MPTSNPRLPVAYLMAALAPFALTWTKGRCPGCHTAVELGHIEFISRMEAWAVGYNSGTRGPGNAIVVHTTDGGATWREIPETAQDGGAPNGPPAFWFIDSERGWVSASLAAEDPLTVTTFDGADHWLSLGPLQLHEMRFFDETRGFATEGAFLLRTRDGGLHWADSGFPQVRAIDRMFFLNPEVGWIAGTDGKAIFVARTSDGGRSWEQSRIAPPASPERVQDLFFADPARGWLIAWAGEGRGTSVFATADSGRTWSRQRDPAFQGPGRWATTIRFVSPNGGFLFEKSDMGERTLFYTIDAGAHWIPQQLEVSVNDCQIFEGDLSCSAGDEPEGFRILTLHPGPSPR